MARNASVQFPGESARYRTARNKLLAAEKQLRKQVEQVARLRRRLPVGGLIPEDYTFAEGASDLADATTVRSVKLSELFREGKDTLALYSYMFSSQMKQPCPMCTSFLDSLNGTAPHATQRINLAVVARSPIARIRDLARGRGWTNLRLLSDASNTYHLDYYGENTDGAQMPMMNIFVRRDGKILHFYGTELLYAKSEKGQDNRHIDMMWPLWNLLDLTPEGRGANWYPRLAY